jgi:putative ABC transport system permease protein
MNALDRAWVTSLVRRQGGRLVATVAGVAVAVALLVTLAGFFAATEATMTRQAIADVVVDWQIQLAPGVNPQAAIAELTSAPGTTMLAEVGYADTPGFEATTDGTTQTTGAGKVLGIPADYRTLFPGEIRDLVGQGQVLLAQQTAANLHAAPGTTIVIKRAGLAPVEVTVDAVIDLPLADSLFQVVGVPAGTAPQAPPDNVLLLPLDRWHALFDAVAQVAPDAVRTQLHASIPHTLPASPTAAYSEVTGEARNYEVRLAGTGVVADNLSARLGVARSDALYVRVLFLFLGLPGAILAALLTAVLIASGANRRRRDQALLRLRGASPAQIVRLAGLEAAVVGIGGGLLGLGLAVIAIRSTFGQWGFGDGASSLLWAGVTLLTGFGLALLTILAPAWRDSRETSIAAARATVSRAEGRWWERIGLDLILLAVSAYMYWQAGRGGYQLVLAPEGVPKVAVSYTSFFAPLLLWIGVALLTMRLAGLLLGRGGRTVTPLIRPLGGRLAGLVAASLSRQQTRIATGLLLVVLAVAFASSTAVFNSTYQAQALVDAELSNGADVTVTGGVAANLSGRLADIAALPGVTAVEPMLHRFAYVGTDLQDLYGVDPATLANATRLANAYFVGGNAESVMAKLAATPDGVLVSPETVVDFQLQPGDTINLRLQRATDHQYHAIPFHYVGIAREFPTAPSDSFLVANAAYVTAQTGSPSVETLLIKTNDAPAAVADRIRDRLGGTAGASVRDIQEQRRIINSGLTAVSLSGLTRIELVFAVGLASAGAGLVLALGLEERRRTLAIASALGATSGQLGAFVWSEAGLILAGGVVGGGALGWGVSHMLIKLLTHVFDPPPETATVPWGYLSLVVAVSASAIYLAGQAATRSAQRGVLTTIRQM